MLSAYSWSQFGLFMLAVVLLYYLVVGLLYYRAELASLLANGRRGVGSIPATATVPPALVRPTSAFAPTPPATVAAPEAAAEEEGAAENLPPATEAVVEGQLPASTTTATGQDQSVDDSPLMDAAAASAEEQAAVQDQTRTEAPDQADERLAELVRREAHAEADPPAAADHQPDELLKAEPALQQQLPASYEPLASFEEPVASPLDIIAAGPAPQLVAAESVSEYIALLQAGQNPPAPAGLQGSCLAGQMAQHLEAYQAELAALFGADEL